MFSCARPYPTSRRLPSAGELVLSIRSGTAYREWPGNDWQSKPLFRAELKCPSIEESPSTHESQILRIEHSYSIRGPLQPGSDYPGSKGNRKSPKNASRPPSFPGRGYSAPPYRSGTGLDLFREKQLFRKTRKPSVPQLNTHQLKLVILHCELEVRIRVGLTTRPTPIPSRTHHWGAVRDVPDSF